MITVFGRHHQHRRTMINLNTVGTEGIVSRHSPSGGSVYYAFDPSGNLAQRMDTEANVLASVRFDAYGNKTGTDASPDPYSGFGGQAGYYTDSETGLELLGHRFYDPANGRFVNRDPIGYDGGLNLYGYVGNDPVNGVDPNGFSGPSLLPGIGEGIEQGVSGLGNGLKVIGIGVESSVLGPILALGGTLLLQTPAGPSNGDEWGPSDPRSPYYNSTRSKRKRQEQCVSDKPSAADCDTAEKLLTDFERLAEKYNVKLGDRRIKQMKDKKDQISSNDLPATLKAVFPARFAGKTLAEIRKECGK